MARMKHALLFLLSVALALGARFLLGPVGMIAVLLVAVVAMWFVGTAPTREPPCGSPPSP
jgi:hypothetical protein